MQNQLRIALIGDYNSGINRHYGSLLTNNGLSVAGVDDRGEIRAVELAGHPFFIATLFQPERSALRGAAHPLIAAFVKAAEELRAIGVES